MVSFMHQLGITANIENVPGVSTTLGHDAISMAQHLAAYSGVRQWRLPGHATAGAEGDGPDRQGARGVQPDCASSAGDQPGARVRHDRPPSRPGEALPRRPRAQAGGGQVGHDRGVYRLDLHRLHARPRGGGVADAHRRGVEMQVGLRVPGDELPTLRLAVPDVGPVRRERRRLGVEAVSRGVLREASLAGFLDSARWSGVARGVLVRRRAHDHRRFQRDLLEGGRRAAAIRAARTRRPGAPPYVPPSPSPSPGPSPGPPSPSPAPSP